MSGPAVVIGFILLIPSIVGMIVSVLMFVGVIAVTATVPLSGQSEQTGFDLGFRHSCATSFRTNYQANFSITPSNGLTEQYCECALSSFKRTGSREEAAEICLSRAQAGTLPEVAGDVDDLYSSNASRRAHEEDSGLLRLLIGIFGTSAAVALLITSFVGGLLGWLLVMRKRVLQCDLCGAVVNAY